MKVTCYKGGQAGDKKVYEFNVEDTLDKIRERLTIDGFISSNEGDTIAYRFVNAQSTSTEFKEAVVGREYEGYIPLKKVMAAKGVENQLVLTNIRASSKPDLLGIDSSSFVNRHVEVSISLNNEDPQARATNTKLQAFEPMMLSNVRTTNPNLGGYFEHACVCVDRSIVSFTINSWGAAGCEISVASKAEPIVTNFYYTLGDSPNRYESYTFRRYSNKEQTIQIVGLDHLDIGSNVWVSYQQVTFKTRRMTAYRSNGRYYQSTQSPPLPGFLAQNRLLAGAQNRAVVPGDKITPATPMPGPHSEQKFGTVSDMEVDDWTAALGEINVYFFAFKNLEQAKQVIGGYNAPEPNLWS